MTDTDKQKVPTWFLAAGIVAVALVGIGVIVGPADTFNLWMIAGLTVSTASLTIMFVSKRKKG